MGQTPVYRVQKSKKPTGTLPGGLSGNKSLTITYFHTGCSTIIGAKSFHGPVRDGKGWDRLAMVIRHDLSTIVEEVIKQCKCYITVKVIGTSRTGN